MLEANIYIVRATWFIFLVLFLAGCNTTKGIGHKNPEFSNYKLSKVAVSVDAQGEFAEELESRVVKKLQERGIQAQGTMHMARFSSSFEEFKEEVWALEISEVFIISFNDGQNSNVAGFQSWGSATSYSNSYNTTTYGSSTTVPIRTFHRSMMTSMFVMNSDGENVWAGNTERRAHGLLFTGDDLTLSETVKALISALESDGLVPKA